MMACAVMDHRTCDVCRIVRELLSHSDNDPTHVQVRRSCAAAIIPS